MSDNQFKLQINFTKAYVDETDSNYAFIEGIASGPEVDLTGERMSVEALKSMVESFKRKIIEFRNAHKTEWNDDIGELVELYLTDDNHLAYKSRIDLNLSGSKDLFYRMTTLGKKFGVSVGGAVLKAGMEYVAELGRQVFTYFDVELNEISVTRQAAYQYSFADIVTKSLPTKEEPMTKTEQTDVAKTEVEETNQDTTLTEDVAAVEADATTEAQETTQSEDEEVTTEESEEAAAEADATTDESQEAESTEDEVEKSTDATTDETVAAAAEATTEVAKAAVLGSCAEADVAYEAVNSLSWNLKWFLWDVVIDTDKSKDEKDALIAAALSEFARIVQSVTSALIESGVDEDMAKSAEAERAQTPETLSKSLTETNTKAEELQKSLDTTTTELETTRKSLAEKEEELEKRDARKTVVFDKFQAAESDKVDPKSVQQAANKQFASFITGGVRWSSPRSSVNVLHARILRQSAA